MPGEPKDLEATLALVVQELDHLRDGVRLLGLKQCGCCRKFFLSTDGRALLDVGQFVCRDCVPVWWQQTSPLLSIEERRVVEHKLLRWLVAYHNAKVVRQAGKMPRAEEMELKIVVECERCQGTGKNFSAGECANCEGRGSVWVVGLRPELQ
jgi:hypothetical protein